MYRIIEEKTTITKTSKFYIQKHHNFLCWNWWSKLRSYYPSGDFYVYTYNTFRDAKADLDIIENKIEITIYT
jgi:hypothetical protein